MSSTAKVISLRWISVLIGATIASSFAGCNAINRIEPVQSQGVVSSSPNPPAVVAEADYVARVVQATGAAIVRIDSVSRVAVDQNPDVEQFSGRQNGGRSQVQRGTGSGFIISADGQILTNAHVVNGTDRVTVVLKDGRRLQGRVIGADTVTDIAVVKVNATGLPTVRLGDSDKLLPGQAAIAIGNPLGLNNTVTQGIISATGRSSSDLGEPDRRIDFLQTDAAINPGNSGGPLLNASGEVIGVNTAIIQGAQGIGFAIPINSARRIADQLIAKGRVDHPYLGVQMTELTPEVQALINQNNPGVQIKRDRGVVIVGVVKNSPAARSGLRPGDIIEQINGSAIENSTQVQQRVDQAGLGNPLELTVTRNAQQQKVTVRPEALPAQRDNS